MKTENKSDKKKLSANPTLHSENNRFSLCPDSYFAQGQFRNRTVPGRNSYFARQSENSGIEPCQVGIPTLPDKVRIPTLSRTNSRIVPIPTLRRTHSSHQFCMKWFCQYSTIAQLTLCDFTILVCFCSRL